MLVKQRHPVFHALVTPAIGNGLIERVIQVQPAKGCRIARTEFPEGFRRKQNLIGWCETEYFKRHRPPLGFSLEGEARFQLVTQAHLAPRTVCTWWSDLLRDPASAHVAGFHHVS